MNQQTITQKIDILASDAHRIDRSLKFAAQMESATASFKPKTLGDELLLFSAHLIALIAVGGAVAIGGENAFRLVENRQLLAVNI